MNMSLLDFPSRLNTPEDYERACADCEKWVTMTQADRDAVLPLLAYDRRTVRGSSCGRALQRDYAPLRLCAGDRLEPNRLLPDVGKFEDISVFPALVLWWRVPCQTLVLHRCPLLNSNIGITLFLFCIDVMHTIYLGVLQHIAKRLVLL